MNWTTLPSSEDLSVNFLKNTTEGKHEARYVRRTDEYFIVYLSSHDGCRMGCRFCHLTQMGENSMRPVSLEEYVDQAVRVLKHYDEVVGGGGQPRAQRVHFNFMSRGDALANPVVLNDFSTLRERLANLAAARGLESRFKVSSILPKLSQDADLTLICGEGVAIYYSLYSLDPAFRRRWLPNAMDPHMALERLADWQRKTGGRVVLHWALIAGENDNVEQARAIAKAVREVGLRTKFNLVRYNSAGVKQGSEADEKSRARYFEVLSGALSEPSRIVPRVGFDVAASCGMFVA